MSVGGGLSPIRDADPIEAQRCALVSWGLERRKHMFTHLFDCDKAIALQFRAKYNGWHFAAWEVFDMVFRPLF